MDNIEHGVRDERRKRWGKGVIKWGAGRGRRKLQAQEFGGRSEDHGGGTSRQRGETPIYFNPRLCAQNEIRNEKA